MIGFSAQISVVSPLEPAKLVSSARKPSPCVFSELLRVVFAEIFFFPPLFEYRQWGSSKFFDLRSLTSPLLCVVCLPVKGFRQ